MSKVLDHMLLLDKLFRSFNAFILAYLFYNWLTIALKKQFLKLLLLR